MFAGDSHTFHFQNSTKKPNKLEDCIHLKNHIMSRSQLIVQQKRKLTSKLCISSSLNLIISVLFYRCWSEGRKYLLWCVMWKIKMCTSHCTWSSRSRTGGACASTPPPPWPVGRAGLWTGGPAPAGRPPTTGGCWPPTARAEVLTEGPRRP